LGGFDVLYEPGYYEDTDYCFELRRRGRRVYYQPASVVVHLEGYTSGTDTTRGMKAYQERNHSIFCEKWALALAEQPAPPHVADRAAEYRFVSRRPSGGRRVLVCAPLMPEFDRESGSKRIDDLITLLLEAGWEVSFYAQSAGPWSRRYIRTLQQRGVMVYAGVESQEMGDLFTWGRHELIALGQFDLAILAFWHVAEKFMDAIRSLSPRTRIVVDSIDLHFLREMRRMLNDPAIALLPGEGRYLCELAREVNTYHGADAVFAVSQKEADLVNDLLSVPHRALAIGDTERGPSDVQGFDGRRGILLLGSFRHLPNLEAAEHFLTEILPLLDRRLLAEHPVYIVGTDMEKTSLPRTVRDPAVRLVGWVPTVEPYLDTCRITILPLKHGAGTKRKMIQALIHGTPSVSTSVGTEGLDLVDGTHVLVADTPSAFAAAIERLLEDRELWSRLSEAGRRHGQARHGHAAATAALQAAVADVMARPIRPLHPPVLP
jgi:glycosyltransferase involved in cell wall biosynthesis